MLYNPVTMTTSFQLRDAFKLLTEQSVPTKLTYGDIWDGQHFTFGFSRMFRKECPTCGSNPSFPYLNKQIHYMQRYVVEIQYNMIMIKFPRKWYVNFLSNITLIIEKTNI